MTVDFNTLISKEQTTPYRNKDLFRDIEKKRKEIENKNKEDLKIVETARIKNSRRYTSLDTDEEKERFLNASLERISGTTSLKDKLLILLELKEFKFCSIDELNTKDYKSLLFYDYDTGKYTDNQTFKDDIINALGFFTKIQEQKELFNALRQKAKVKKLNNDPNIINFKNGVFNGKTKEFSEERNPKIINTRAINHDYPTEHIKEPSFERTNAYGNKIEWKPSDVIESFAQGDENRKKLFLQSVRAILGTDNNVFLYICDKNGGSGKSTIGLLFYAIATKENTKTLNLNSIGQRFSLGDLKDTVYIYGDELEANKHITETGASIFKSLVDNKPIQTEEKGKQGTQQFFNGLWVQLGNFDFLTEDLSGGMFRRLKIINMENEHIPKEQRLKDVQNEFIFDKEVVQWFIQETLNAYPTAVKEFETPSNNDLELENIKREADEFFEFVEYLDEEYLQDCTKLPAQIIRNFIANRYDGNNGTKLFDRTAKQFNKRIEPYLNDLGWYLPKEHGRNKKVSVNLDDLNNELRSHETITKNYFNEKPYKTFSGVFIRK